MCIAQSTMCTLCSVYPCKYLVSDGGDETSAATPEETPGRVIPNGVLRTECRFYSRKLKNLKKNEKKDNFEEKMFVQICWKQKLNLQTKIGEKKIRQKRYRQTDIQTAPIIYKDTFPTWQNNFPPAKIIFPPACQNFPTEGGGGGVCTARKKFRNLFL